MRGLNDKSGVRIGIRHLTCQVIGGTQSDVKSCNSNSRKVCTLKYSREDKDHIGLKIKSFYSLVSIFQVGFKARQQWFSNTLLF